MLFYNFVRDTLFYVKNHICLYVLLTRLIWLRKNALFNGNSYDVLHTRENIVWNAMKFVMNMSISITDIQCIEIAIYSNI